MLRTRRSPFTLAAAVALTFALGACGGGGSSLPASGIGSVTQPTTPTQNDNAPAKMVISIPPKSAASSMRNPKYISASTKSMTIGILSNGKTTQVAEADLTPYLLTRYFGLRAFSTLYGFTWTAYAIAGAIGPVWMGKAFDATGSYASLLTTLSAATLVSAGLLLLLPRYPVALRTVEAGRSAS